MQKKRMVLFLVCILLFSILCLPTAWAQSGKFSKLSDLSGKRFAMLSGTSFDTILPKNEAFTDHESYSYYNSDVDSISSLRSGKSDAVLLDRPIAEMIVSQYDDIMIFPEAISPDPYGFGFTKGSALIEPFNAAMHKLKGEGLDEELKAKWMGTDESAKVLIKQDWPGKNGTLRFWVNTGTPPMSYLGPEGTPVGFTVDYVLHVAREMDYAVEVTECAFDGLIPALISGKADLAGRAMSITEERKKSIDFSDPFYEGAAVLVVRTADVDPALLGEAAKTAETGTSFWEEIKSQFNATFVTENRWEWVWSGILTTLIISLASIILGSLLGFLIYLFCWRLGKHAFSAVDNIAGVIVGIPAVVFLMILYYVIFGKTTLSGVIVSVISFSIIFGITVYRLIRTGSDAIDKGQFEGAYALGYSKPQTFFSIIFPQAVAYIFPIYRGELSSLLRATAIVGYIAVQDLTRIGDLIRSRTFMAFFPLISVAIIYYLLGKLFTLIADLIQRRSDPTRRKEEQILKGAKIDV